MTSMCKGESGGWVPRHLPRSNGTGPYTDRPPHTVLRTVLSLKKSRFRSYTVVKRSRKLCSEILAYIKDVLPRDTVANGSVLMIVRSVILYAVGGLYTVPDTDRLV